MVNILRALVAVFLAVRAGLCELLGAACVLAGVAVLFGQWAWIAAGVALLAKAWELDR